jgi:glutamine amidotransferase
MPKVAIINYEMGNLDSVARAIEHCGGEAVITKKGKDVGNATHIILPGVGAFKDGIENLKKNGLDMILKREIIENKIPLLGICLGMQLLATMGNEGGKFNGLNFIEGEVVRLSPKISKQRIPHIGWNEVLFTKGCPLFCGIPSGKDFYFAHSYHFLCKDKNNIVSETPYCGKFISAVQKDNIFGVQFHPEKSQKLGLLLIKNFLNFNLNA